MERNQTKPHKILQFKPTNEEKQLHWQHQSQYRGNPKRSRVIALKSLELYVFLNKLTKERNKSEVHRSTEVFGAIKFYLIFQIKLWKMKSRNFFDLPMFQPSIDMMKLESHSFLKKNLNIGGMNQDMFEVLKWGLVQSVYWDFGIYLWKTERILGDDFKLIWN